MLKELFSRVGEYRKYAVLTPVLMTGEVLMEVLIPTIMAEIIDRGVYTGDMPFIIRMSILLIFTAIISLIFGVANGVTASKASAGFSKNLRRDMFDKIQTFSFSNMDEFSTSSLVTRMTTDIQNIQQAFQASIRICWRAPMMFIFAMIMVIRNGGNLSLIFLIAMPIIGGTVAILFQKVKPIFERMFRSYDRLNRTVEENLTGIRTVKAYVTEEQEKEKFNTSSKKIYDDNYLVRKLLLMANPIMQSVSYACMLIISYVCARAINTGDMQTGQLMSIFTYTMQILSSLTMIAMVTAMLATSRAARWRVYEILTSETDMDPNIDGVSEVENGSIEFDHVSFSYNTSPCLKDIDLKVESGETVGILGVTGSGKSTLISLIARLYDATKGTVRVAGRDVRDYSLKALRESVSVVLQKNQLFSGTVRSNMKWGNEFATDEEIINAIRMAKADFALEGDGLDRKVEQEGSNFSGGQKQRLCIARALLRNPKILIFDDSTSAVDTKTDMAIRNNLRSACPGATKIIISQRVSSIADADKIVIMENGRIQDVGTHDELLARNQEYIDLVNVQMGARK